MYNRIQTTHSNLPSENVFTMNRVEIARALLQNNDVLQELNLTDHKEFIDAVRNNMLDNDSWNNYKNNNIDNKDVQGILQKIDVLINDHVQQEYLLTKAEMKQYYPEYYNLLFPFELQIIQVKNELNNAVNEANDVAYQQKKNELIQWQIKKNDYNAELGNNDLYKEMLEKSKSDYRLKELLQSVRYLTKNHDQAMKEETEKEAILSLEILGELGSSVDEIIEEVNESHEFVKTINEVREASSANMETSTETSTETSAPESLTNLGYFLHTIPVVNDVIRGYSYLKESYEAYHDKHSPQRLTKIMAGTVGGLVSVGVAIVSTLLLTGIGVLGTASAIIFAPIVLSAAVLGIYSVTLYRDSYILHQSRLRVEKAKQALHHTMIDLDILKERLISDSLKKIDQTSAKYQKMLSLQKNIIEKRRELYSLSHAAQSHPNDKQKIVELQKSVLKLREDRNNEIIKHSEISAPLHTAFVNDPRVARITIERARLESSLGQLKNTRKKGKFNVGMSALCVVGFSLALGAICLTGIGALVVGVVASSIIIGATVGRVGYNYQQREHQEKKTINDTSFTKESSAKIDKKSQSSHSNILYIEKEIFHHDNKKVSQHLLTQLTQLPEIKNEVNNVKNTMFVKPNNTKPECTDEDSSSDRDNRSPNHHI